MAGIKKVAVLGSGVMGGAIAAHIANAGVPVVLLDIVPKDSNDRSALAKGAVARMLKQKPAPFMHKRHHCTPFPLDSMSKSTTKPSSRGW